MYIFVDSSHLIIAHVSISHGHDSVHAKLHLTPLKLAHGKSSALTKDEIDTIASDVQYLVSVSVNAYVFSHTLFT